MKGKIRRIISILLMVCFIASGTAASASACSCYFNIHSYLFSGNDVLTDVSHCAYSLHYGSQGPAVKLVQTGLWEVGYPPADRRIDGDYKINTEDAVKKYQASKGYLTKDGKVGPCTLHALDQDVARHEGRPY